MFTSSGTSQIMSVILGKYVETLKVEREIHSKCGEVKKNLLKLILSQFIDIVKIYRKVLHLWTDRNMHCSSQKHFFCDNTKMALHILKTRRIQKFEIQNYQS